MHSLPVLCVLVLIPATCTVQHVQPCSVIPKKKYFEMGSNIEVTCQSSCSPGQVFWTLNNVRINDSLSKTVNSTYTVLLLKNFTWPSATFQCHSFKTEHVLGGTTIKTYPKPSKVSCVLEAIKSWGLPNVFTCSWEHRMDSSSKRNYTVSASCPSCADNDSQTCIRDTTSCQFKYTPKMSHDIVISVKVETADWKADSDNYIFHYFQILKINPPNITVKALFSHLLVELNQGNYNQYVTHCQVKYSKALSEGTQEWMINKSMNPMEKKGNVTIEVESCTNYTVSARCALDKAPWSNWSEKRIIRSQLNKSAIKLGLWRKVDEPDSHGVRKVHAMWTRIPPTCEGEFHYAVFSTPYKRHLSLTDEISCTITSHGPSTCEVDVDREAHRITLTVFHNEKMLAEESTYVPAIGESLPKVRQLQTSNHENDILVSWEPPDQPVGGYMIDWTHDGIQYFWTESENTSTTLSKLQEFKPYNITVTPLLDDKTGLGTQAFQICSKLRALETVTFTNILPKHKNALVSWNMESLRQCTDAVVNYTVFYEAGKAPLLNVTVDSTKQEVLLEDLKPDTQYGVYVMARALTGNASSSRRYFETRKYDPGLITLLSICGGVAIFLVLSLGLCCAILWKKFKEKMVPNPGLSSLALWLSQSPQKIFQPFSDPSESHTIIEKVYPCELDITPACTSPQAAGFDDNPNPNPASDPTEEKTDPAIPPTSLSQEERPDEPVEAPSPTETAALLASENGPPSPYRTQSSVESPGQSSSEQCKHLPGPKQPSKTAPLTVYVTLDMFEQGQGR